MVLRLFLLLILSIPLFAADVKENTYTLFSSAGFQGLILGDPREQIIPLNVDTVMAYLAYYGSATDNFFLLTGHGDTKASGSYFGGTRTLHNHAHFTSTGNIISTILNDYTDNDSDKIIWRINAVTDTPSIIDSMNLGRSGEDDDMGFIAWYGVPNMMLVERVPDSVTCKYYLSTDSGKTFGANQGFVYNYNTNVRVDVDEMGDSVAMLVYVIADEDLFFHLWNGSAWGDRETVLDGTLLCRHFAMAVGRYNIVHVAYVDTANPSNVLYKWRDTDGTWSTEDTVFTASAKVTGNDGLKVALVYSEYGGVLRAFYSGNSTSNPNLLYCKRYDYSDQSWGDALTVSNGGAINTIYEVTGCLNVPSSHGDRAYISFIENVPFTYYIRMVTVADSTTEEWTPPGGEAMADMHGGELHGGSLH